MTKHYCGTELRQATEKEIDSAVSGSYALRLKAQDYGKVWFCEKCRKIVFCS